MATVVTTKGTHAGPYGDGVAWTPAQCEKKAAELNRKAEALGIETRYEVKA